MRRSLDLLAMTAAGALGAGLTVLAVGASAAFLIPAVVGVGIAALVTTGRAAPVEPRSRLTADQMPLEAES